MPEPDLGGVLSAATLYGQAVEANIRAELAGRIDTLTLERDDALRVAAAQKTRADDAVNTLAAHMKTHQPTETTTQRLTAVQVFPQRASHPGYGNHPKTLALLGELGIKRVRGLLTPRMSAATIAFYQEAHRRFGIKAWLTVGEPHVALTSEDWADIVDLLNGPLSGIVEMVSGWNEPNHERGIGHAKPGWEKGTAAHCVAMRQHIPTGVVITTAQMWSGDFKVHDADWRLLAPLVQGTYDAIAIHLYPRGSVGSSLVDRFRSFTRSLLGDRKVYCTEAGYSTGDTAGNPVTEAQQAELWPQHLRLYHAGGDACSVFELWEDGLTREGKLGVVRPDGTPKPAFTALKELLAT